MIILTDLKNLLHYIAMREQNTLLENINHHTGVGHFKLHHIRVEEVNESALYLHCHPEAELFYLTEGEMTILVEEKPYHLRAGEGIFIPPNLVHCGKKKPLDSCEFYAVVFSVQWLLGYLRPESGYYTQALENRRLECTYLIDADREENATLLEALSRICHDTDAPIETYELGLAGELLICFQELYNHHLMRLGHRHRKAPDLLQAGIQKSLDEMNEHYMEALTLCDMAAWANYSESHFCHRFKALTGYAPFEYLNRLRIIKAAELLCNSEEKITQIAGSCGFNNISYFNRSFRKIMGVNPMEYRKEKKTLDIIEKIY